MEGYKTIEYQNCDEKSKKKLLLYMQLNDSWWRPSNLAGNMTGVYWNTAYQKRKALDELVRDGHLHVKLFERGHFRYYAYRAKKSITYKKYQSEVKRWSLS